MSDLRAVRVVAKVLILAVIASVAFAALLLGWFGDVLSQAAYDAFLIFFAGVAPASSLNAFSLLDDRKTATQAFLAALVLGFVAVVLPLSLVLRHQDRQLLGEYDWFGGVVVYLIIALICAIDVNRRRRRQTAA